MSGTTIFCDYYELPKFDFFLKISRTPEDLIKLLLKDRGGVWASFQVLSDSKELAKTLNLDISDNDFLNFNVDFTYEDSEINPPKLICNTWISIHSSLPSSRAIRQKIVTNVSFSDLKNKVSPGLLEFFKNRKSPKLLEFCKSYFAENYKINSENFIKSDYSEFLKKFLKI